MSGPGSDPKNKAGDEAIPVKETAERLHCSTRSVYRLLAEEHLKIVKIGRATRVSAASIADFISKGGAR